MTRPQTKRVLLAMRVASRGSDDLLCTACGRMVRDAVWWTNMICGCHRRHKLWLRLLYLCDSGVAMFEP